MEYYYCVKVIFVTKDVSRIVFEGGIFGDVQNIWGNLYLNSITILFDIIQQLLWGIHQVTINIT